MRVSTFQREMIIRSPSRHSHRSSVLTGELSREKNQSYVIIYGVHKGMTIYIFNWI